MLYTVPSLLANGRDRLVTGNEYLSIPDISLQGNVREVDALYYRGNGLLRFHGNDKDLVTPYVQVDHGEEVDWKWRMMEHWVPQAVANVAGMKIKLTILTPVGQKGLCMRVVAINMHNSDKTVTLGFDLCPGGISKAVFNSTQANKHILYYHTWTDTVVMQDDGPALAWGSGSGWQENAYTNQYQVRKSFTLHPGQSESVTIYAAVNKDGDGAATGVIHMRRLGWRRLLATTIKWLAQHRPSFPDNALAKMFYRNLWFNYFFAVGEAADVDITALVTSRSPDYYVSGAFWARDSLLWSFPAVLLVSPRRARALLEAVFSRHLHQAGEHAHYLDGTVLYPGFELDQIAAYVLALQRYFLWTGDFSLIRDLIADGSLTIIYLKLFAQKSESGLYRTFLDPSDDPVKYPFLTYDNVLCWRAFKDLAGFYKLMGNKRLDRVFQSAASILKANIYRHCLADGPLGKMFCWATDVKGHKEIYDAPPGSLQLLSWYGFCDNNAKEYQNTVNWIFSQYNPYYVSGRFSGPGSKHAANPWVLSLANQLLTVDNGEVRGHIDQMPLDNGYACETYHPETGQATTGAAFATCAGFFSYALWERLH